MGRGAGFCPPKLPGCAIWLNADSVVRDNGNIITATDLSGNGRDHTAPAAANRPSWDAGPPAEMVFEDSGASPEYLQGPNQNAVFGASALAIFVHASIIGTEPELLYGSLIPSTQVRLYDNRAEYAGVQVPFARDTALRVRTLWVNADSGGTLVYRQDGVQLGSAPVTLTALGSRPLGVGGIFPLAGARIRTVTAYSGLLSLADVQQVETWMACA